MKKKNCKVHSRALGSCAGKHLHCGMSTNSQRAKPGVRDARKRTSGELPVVNQSDIYTCTQRYNPPVAPLEISILSFLGGKPLPLREPHNHVPVLRVIETHLAKELPAKVQVFPSQRAEQVKGSSPAKQLLELRGKCFKLCRPDVASGVYRRTGVIVISNEESVCDNLIVEFLTPAARGFKPFSVNMETVTVFFGALSFLCLLTSTILMIASNCTVPTSHEIYFLRTTLSAALTREILTLLPPTVAVFDRITVRFGLLGYCINETCTQHELGYKVPAFLTGGPTGFEFLNRQTTTALVINPIFTAFSGLCLAIFLLSILLDKPSLVFLVLIINTIIALVCLIIDLSVFVRVYWLVRHSESGLFGGVSVHYGSALWLMLAAAILTVLSTIFFAFTLRRGDDSRAHKGKRPGRHHGP
ncbi:hypothetical protein VP01_313g7 [Puccinia sorghi]|uniref:Pali-domain-containing protein n=1 Tax=Puccinia sorghi TaxID=27349 RepID=A0A0L6UZT8_9BASI|nr:hypothetical protein VP01_313g7 [Puccinia sorghi]